MQVKITLFSLLWIFRFYSYFSFLFFFFIHQDSCSPRESLPSEDNFFDGAPRSRQVNNFMTSSPVDGASLVRNAPKPPPAPAVLSSAFETLPSGLSLICARAVSSLPSSSSPFSKFASRYKTNKQDRMSENTFKLARQPLQPSNFSRLLFLAAHCDARLSDEEMAGMKVEFSRQIISLSSRWLSLPLTLAGWAWLSFHNSGKGAKNKRIRLMDN